MKKTLVSLFLSATLLLGGCSEDTKQITKDIGKDLADVGKDVVNQTKDDISNKMKDGLEQGKTNDKLSVDSLDNFNIPKYQGNDVVVINRNIPFFTKQDLKDKTPYERFSSLDRYGRAKTAEAVVTKAIMPTIKRSSLSYNPSGWHTIDAPTKRGKQGYLYNRCHLIGYQLTGENNNERNLITCTRKANQINMVLYENEIASYVRNGGVVKMRVTPMYEHNDLVAKGILLEAKSLDSDKISYNVFFHNVEDGFKINYKDGTATKITN